MISSSRYCFSPTLARMATSSVKVFSFSISCEVTGRVEKYCLELRSTSESKRMEIRGHPAVNGIQASRFFLSLSLVRSFFSPSSHFTPVTQSSSCAPSPSPSLTTSGERTKNRWFIIERSFLSRAEKLNSIFVLCQIDLENSLDVLSI